MIACSHIVLMATYNEWMNAKLYEAAAKLSPQELAADRKAFFGSLIGTLNHIVVADTLWLKRLAAQPGHHPVLDAVGDLPTPASLDQVLFADLGELLKRRQMLDGIIKQWAAELTQQDLSQVLSYRNMKGVAAKKNLASILAHFFNHQTHHRGQASTLLAQAGVDLGVTDLLALVPDQVEA